MVMVDLYCRRCRRSLHVSYDVTGDPESPVLPHITLKCPYCTRVMSFKRFQESRLVAHMKDGKYYI